MLPADLLPLVLSHLPAASLAAAAAVCKEWTSPARDPLLWFRLAQRECPRLCAAGAAAPPPLGGSWRNTLRLSRSRRRGAAAAAVPRRRAPPAAAAAAALARDFRFFLTVEREARAGGALVGRAACEVVWRARGVGGVRARFEPPLEAAEGVLCGPRGGEAAVGDEDDLYLSVWARRRADERTAFFLGFRRKEWGEFDATWYSWEADAAAPAWMESMLDEHAARMRSEWPTMRGFTFGADGKPSPRVHATVHVDVATHAEGTFPRKFTAWRRLELRFSFSRSRPVPMKPTMLLRALRDYLEWV
ncbi:hypothetical protein AB1Y20_014984 [Prymnesium parvum]|uniref:F-box domain-containing protein n=1 Tax=Prymnesium parvum TaxID=97485 RepID=A0AB34JX32_PRYPA